MDELCFTLVAEVSAIHSFDEEIKWTGQTACHFRSSPEEAQFGNPGLASYPNLLASVIHQTAEFVLQSPTAYVFLLKKQKEYVTAMFVGYTALKSAVASSASQLVF